MVPTAENFDVVIIGGGPGGLRRRALRRVRRAQHRPGREGQGRRHLPPRGVHPCQGAARDGRRAARHRRLGALRRHRRRAHPRLLRHPAAQAAGHRRACSTASSGLLKRRKVTVYDGIGSLHADHRRDDHRRRVGRRRGHRRPRAARLRLGAAHHPRLRHRRHRVITSDELLSLQELPASAVVIGGGAIGCEFASMMSDLGTEVTILEALPKILPGCDDDVTRVVLERRSRSAASTVRTGVSVTGHEPHDHDGGTTVLFGDGESIDVETVVVVRRSPAAVGRPRPRRHRGRGRRARLRRGRRAGAAPPSRASTPSATSSPPPPLAHVGFAEGIVVIQDILGEDPVPVDYGKVPWCIYCHPEVALRRPHRGVGQGGRLRRGRVASTATPATAGR